MTNEQYIWNYLMKKIKNSYGVAGLMGNLMAESGLRANNLQDSINRYRSITDKEYTTMVDNGTYTNFINDKAGYGLAQWTFWSRKEKLYNYLKSNNLSIGDRDGQLDFLCQEIQETYPDLWNYLLKTRDIQKASQRVLTEYEKPADQGLAQQQKRASYAKNFYNTYANKKIIIKPANLIKKLNKNILRKETK